jgi:hypothetical protein
MSTRSDNPNTVNASSATAAFYRGAGEEARRGVRTADMVKAGIAAITRESSEILAGRFIARRGNNLSTEELG